MNETVNEITKLLLDYRRAATCTGVTCARCAAWYMAKLEPFVARQQTIELVLPAFPVKSPNRAKTLGHLPDMAEEVALRFLQWLCRRIEQVHAPGARIIIASDGRVFSDLIRVPDVHVTEYQAALRQMIEDIGARSLVLFNLEDVIALDDFDEMRRRLVVDYAESMDALREQVRAGGEPLSLYRGITRFLFEDARGLYPDKSNTALQKDARVRAYEVIQRSKAWGALVEDRYPCAVRLSIHPQACESPKLGIHLAATKDNWLTPWHAVILATATGFYLVKKQDAEAMGARLVSIDGRPSHYISTHSSTARWGSIELSDSL